MSVSWKHVGFIRTYSLLKSIGLFAPENVLYVSACRSKENDPSATIYRSFPTRNPFLNIEVHQTRCCHFLWNGRSRSGNLTTQVYDDRLKGKFSVLDSVRAYINVNEMGDFYVDEIQYVFENPKVVGILNDWIDLNVSEVKKKRTHIKDKAKLYATFKSYCGEELKRLDFLKELNHKEISEYGFRVATLDLVDLHTERAEKYGEHEHINIDGDPQLIRAVLESLDWDGWAKDTRIVKNSEVRPVAIRNYKLTGGQIWELDRQVEL